MNKREQLAALQKLLEERRERERFAKIDFVNPYVYQHDVLKSSADNAQTLFMAANRVGKSFTGGMNLSYHATGLYPEWWEGYRWREPINAWAAGVSAQSTRDILQSELLGPHDDPYARGTGLLPKKCIGETTRRPQVPNGIESVLVQHHTDGHPDGWSRITFKSYEQGESKFMGSSCHEIWLDEQPPDGIFTQCITRTATTGGHVLMTFTPEDGVTPVVHQFMNERQPGQCLIGATWNDAPHLTEEVKKQLLGIYNEHEREMRTKGVPIFGSGPVFQVPEQDLVIDPFEIPDYWPGVCGLDFGWDHPTACAWLRWDRDADIIYVVDEYRKRTETAMIHAIAIASREGGFPVAWPHDGMIHDKGSGTPMADQYRQHGVNMLPTHFTNPLAPGEVGKGNIRVEPGINHMHERMQTGRFKVFKTCRDWFEEYRMYHREDGRIYAVNDDLMSATRYAVQSLRFAETPQTLTRGYGKGFDSKLKYEPLELLA